MLNNIGKYTDLDASNVSAAFRIVWQPLFAQGIGSFVWLPIFIGFSVPITFIITLGLWSKGYIKYEDPYSSWPFVFLSMLSFVNLVLASYLGCVFALGDSTDFHALFQRWSALQFLSNGAALLMVLTPPCVLLFVWIKMKISK